MQSRKTEAAERKSSGEYNCAQAVICTYCDKCGINEDTAMNIGSAFGSGMGNTRGTCGALIGAGVVLGLVNKSKAKSMKDMRTVMDKFQERNGATQCRLLKGLDGGRVLRECSDCVADAAEFLEQVINE